MRSRSGVFCLFAFALMFTGSGAALSADNYFNSYDGETGPYINLSWTFADVDDAKVKTFSGEAKRTFSHDEGYGGVGQFGYDFGKIRVDWRLGGIHADIDDIDGTAPRGSSQSLIGYSTLNLAFDIYRFGPKKGVGVVPFVGGGIGGAAGWTNGKREADNNLLGMRSRDRLDLGLAYTAEAGLQLDLMKGLSATVAYTFFLADFMTREDEHSADNHLLNAGLRYTF